jgi:asparagine synthase (glutamine-hydrolysing)
MSETGTGNQIVRSSLAGAIGRGATEFVAARCGDAKPVLHETERLIFAGKNARVVSGENAICLIIGRPHLSQVGSGPEGPGSEGIEHWKAALLGQPSEIDAHVSGHFAAVYVDFAVGHVLLLTDRFGSYPLYYRHVGDGIAFADRADALFNETPQLSSQALFDYLYFHCLPGPDSVHEEVLRLEPGRVLRWEDRTSTEHNYWNRRADKPLYSDFGEAREDFRLRLKQSVQIECGEDTTGAFLSGGTDSSTVVGMLSECSKRPVRSYSIGFDVPGYDEARYARLASDRFGTLHKEYYVTPDDLVARLPGVAASLDQPFGNSSLLPALICAERAAEDGVTRLLAGDGGDELFGGNTRYAKQRVFGWYDRVPNPVKRILIEPVTGSKISASVPVLRKFRNYVQHARVPMPDRFETYNLLEREGVANILTEAWLQDIDVERPRRLQGQVWLDLAAENLIDRMLEYDWKFTLADNDLRKVRYAASMAGIEVGFPLLSNELTDFSLRLRPDWKVRGFNLRWFFKKALSDFLPQEIIRKKKHGFGLPFGSWVCEHPPLRKIAVPAVLGLVDRGLVNQGYVKLLLEDRLPKYPHFYGEMVWILMMLELWLQAHSPDWKVSC